MSRRPAAIATRITAALLCIAGCSGGSDDGASPFVDTESESAADTTPAGEGAEENAEPSGEELGAVDANEQLMLDTAPLAARIDALVSTLVFENTKAPLDECPTDVTYTMISQMIPASAFERAGIADTRDDVDGSATAWELLINESALLGCSTVGGEDGGVGVDIAAAPSSVESYLREFNDPDSLGDLAFETTPAGSFGGGEFHHIRIDTALGAADPFITREVLWLNDDVMVTGYAFGAAFADVDLDRIEETIEEYLPTIVESALT